MSLGYADRLKQKRNLGGQLGAQEYHEEFNTIKDKVQKLASWVADAKSVFIFTGAGISTSCGIPDFRGPNGIWTLRKKKLPVNADFVPFEYAKPTFTHQAISALVACGKSPYVCSQNVDSLHIRSGVPRSKLAELHGNCFAERCATCQTEYQRDFQMTTVNFKATGRRCTREGCGGELRDNILDWDSPLPDAELDAAIEHADGADVALVLGTSLQIQPANEIPVMTRDSGGKMVIVNLQKTPKDRRASMLLHSKVDVVMALLMQHLGMQVPPYIREERVLLSHTVQPSSSSSSGGVDVQLQLASCHGSSCPLPIIEAAEVVWSSEASAGAGADGGGATSSAAPASAGWGPSSSGRISSDAAYVFQLSNLPEGVARLSAKVQLRLVKWADEDKRDVVLHHSIDVREALGRAHERKLAIKPEGDGCVQQAAGASCQEYKFVSQELHYRAEQVIADFQSNPPAVVLPQPRSKKPKATPTAGGASVPAAPARAEPPANVRRSQRTTKTTGRS